METLGLGDLHWHAGQAGVQHRSTAAQKTENMGERFTEEARKIHYGETEERGIRGQASREATAALTEEGIAVVPLPLPEVLKGP